MSAHIFTYLMELHIQECSCFGGKKNTLKWLWDRFQGLSKYKVRKKKKKKQPKN